MPTTQSGANATANVGTYNDVNGHQKNTTKSGNVKNVYNYACSHTECNDDDDDSEDEEELAEAGKGA